MDIYNKEIDVSSEDLPFINDLKELKEIEVKLELWLASAQSKIDELIKNGGNAHKLIEALKFQKMFLAATRRRIGIVIRHDYKDSPIINEFKQVTKELGEARNTIKEHVAKIKQLGLQINTLTVQVNTGNTKNQKKYKVAQQQNNLLFDELAKKLCSKELEELKGRLNQIQKQVYLDANNNK